jgi:hypothetical protein
MPQRNNRSGNHRRLFRTPGLAAMLFLSGKSLEAADMRSLVPILGPPYMPTEHMILLVGLTAIAVLLLGWIADTILHDEGFGIIANGLIMIAGGTLGLVLWNRLGYLAGGDQTFIKAITTAISGVALLVACGVGGRFV